MQQPPPEPPRKRATKAAAPQSKVAQSAPGTSSFEPEQASTGDPVAGPKTPNLWVFYSTADAGEPWVQELRSGRIVFWYSGRAGGRAPNNALSLERGDTVLLLVSDQIVGEGVLIADARETFADEQGRRRWPIAVATTYSRPIDRTRIETAGGELVRGQGAIHRVLPRAMDILNRARREQKLDHVLPYAWDDAEQVIAVSEGLGAALSRNPSITLGATENTDQEPPSGIARSTDDDRSNPDLDARTRFIEDAPSETEDRLDRGPIALFLARRLHLIWCEMNGCSPDSARRVQPGKPWDRDNFIIHVDSPWGGGKTTFANFVARALDPGDEPLEEGHFLWSSLSPAARERLAKAQDRSEIFAADFGQAFRSDNPKAWAQGRKPWIIARYNAWREQSAQPPWWQVFWSVNSAIHDALGRDMRGGWWWPWRRGLRDPERALTSRAAIWLRIQRYKLGNPKLKAQVLAVAALLLALGVLLFAPGIWSALGKKEIAELKNVGAVLGLLGAGGLGVLALFSLLGQSLSPDLDFSSESKNLGVADPIGRFRRMFDDILRRADRPVLLIVDDLDRCEPKTVVEVLRGLQTIVRSPRMFVMVLGDRNWIETAHQTYHKDMGDLAVGSETRLGARFVEKVFQLSFRLPAIKPEMRDQYTRGSVARGAPAKPLRPRAPEARPSEVAPAQQPQQQQQQQQAAVAAPTEQALAAFEARLDEILADPAGISRREAQIATAKNEAVAAGCDAAELDDIASRRLVAAAGADASHQSEVSSILVALADSLPGNPRQIKRIMNTFAVYETVGRIHFNYQLSNTGEGGEERARRWRQLALWVTLATEWPETWRAIAKRPDLIEVAYGPAEDAAPREERFIAGLEAGQEEAMKTALRRLKTSASLQALLTGSGLAASEATAAGFAGTEIDQDAVREFNRIIWEPGFASLKAASPRQSPPASA